MDITASTSIPLDEFYDQLERCDWTACMSDSWAVAQRGEQERNQLKEIAAQSGAHKALFDAMELWGWGRGDKPVRPEGIQ